MALVGHLRGGLAHVNVVVGMFLSGISGSSTADAAAIGAVFFPAMKRRGYDEKFAVCLTACTSTMGAVIPPSILMVIYGATAGVSIGALLIGGIIPGVLMGLALMVQSHFFAVKYDFPREHPHFLGMRRRLAGDQGGGLAAGRAGDHRRRHGGRCVHAYRIGRDRGRVRAVHRAVRVPQPALARADAAFRRDGGAVLAGAVLPRRWLPSSAGCSPSTGFPTWSPISCWASPPIGWWSCC